MNRFVYALASLIALLAIPYLAHAQAAGSVYSGNPSWQLKSAGIADWIWAVDVNKRGEVYVGSDRGGIYRSADQGTSWESRNNGLINLYVASIAFHPQHPDTMFVGTWGGIHRSYDGGLNWTLLDDPVFWRDGVPMPRATDRTAIIGTVAVDPLNPNVVYAGTGTLRQDALSGGQGILNTIFRSTDGGNTWTADTVTADPTAIITRIIPSPMIRGEVYVSTSVGFYYKNYPNNTGWQPRSSGITNTRLSYLAIDPVEPWNLYAVAHPDSIGIGRAYRTADFGLHWWNQPNGLPEDFDCGSSPDRAGEYSWIGVGPQRVDPAHATVFLANNNFHYCNGIYFSVNGGGNWERRTHWRGTALANVEYGWIGDVVPERHNNLGATAIAFDPTDPNRIYFASGASTVHRSDDMGETWLQIYENTTSNGSTHRGMAQYGGILTITMDAPDSTLFVGTADHHNGLQRSVDFGQLWQRMDGAETGSIMRQGDIIVHPSNRNIVYAVVWYGPPGGTLLWRVFRSTNRGFDWASWDLNLPSQPSDGEGIHIVLNRSSNTFYAGTYDGLIYYRPLSGATAWQYLSGPASFSHAGLSDLAIDQTGRLYASFRKANSNSVFESATGQLWTPIASGAMYSVLTLHVDPYSTLYAGTETAVDGDLPGVFRYSGSAGSWTPVITWGPQAPSASCASWETAGVATIATYKIHGVFAGLDDQNYHDEFVGCGLWSSIDGGTTWNQIDDGLPTHRITALYVSGQRNYFFVGVDGSGVYRALLQ